MAELASIASGREAALNIQALFSQSRWPDKALKKKWTIIYEMMIDKKKLEDSIAISDNTVRWLRLRLVDFYKNNNQASVTGNPYCLRLIVGMLDNPALVDPKKEKPALTDTVDFRLRQLARLMDAILALPGINEDIALPLLKVWLRSDGSNVVLRRYVKFVFQGLCNSENVDIRAVANSIQLYVDRFYLFSQLPRSGGMSFVDALAHCSILSEYTRLPYRYFSACFFDWITHLDEYTPELMDCNMAAIRFCTLDEQKVVSAMYITHIVTREDGQDRVQDYLDTIGVSVANMKNYWTLVNDKLQGKFADIVQSAAEICSRMITAGVYSFVFNLLGGVKWLSSGRVLFWASYQHSITDFKICMTKKGYADIVRNMHLADTQKKHDLYESLKQHLIPVRGDEHSQIAIFISFGNLVVVDMLSAIKYGEIQIFQPKNEKVLRFFNDDAGEIASFSDICIYYTAKREFQYQYNPFEEEGAVSHTDSDWENVMESILGSYFIYKDTNITRKPLSPYIRHPLHMKVFIDTSDRRIVLPSIRLAAQELHTTDEVILESIRSHTPYQGCTITVSYS